MRPLVVTEWKIAVAVTALETMAAENADFTMVMGSKARFIPTAVKSRIP
jgi:hypothetical protein